MQNRSGISSLSCCYGHGHGVTCIGCCCACAPPSWVSWSQPDTLTWSWLVFVVVVLVKRSNPARPCCYRYDHDVTCIVCCCPRAPPSGVYWSPPYTLTWLWLVFAIFVAVVLVKRIKHTCSCCYHHGHDMTCLGWRCPHAPPSWVSWSPPDTLTWSQPQALSELWSLVLLSSWSRS
jgi:hypothetical protein